MAKLKTLKRTGDNDWPAPATFKSPEECMAYTTLTSAVYLTQTVPKK